MHDKLLFPVLKLIHKPDGCCAFGALGSCYHHCWRTSTQKKKKKFSLSQAVKKKKKRSFFSDLILQPLRKSYNWADGCTFFLRSVTKQRKSSRPRTPNDNFHTCGNYSDGGRRRGCLWVTRPNVWMGMVGSGLGVCRSVHEAFFQLSLPTLAAMGAHSWPLVFL